MAAKKNPLADKANELYKSGMKLVDIADQLGKPEGTIRRWKSTYGWDGERSEKKSERSVTKRTEKKTQINDGTKETLQNDDLTPEQQMFCIYYSRTFNAAQSYQKAYGCQYSTAVAHGYEMFHGISVDGSKMLKTYLPDMSAPGAVKKGEVELIAGAVLKNSKMAGVLKGIKLLGKTS